MSWLAIAGIPKIVFLISSSAAQVEDNLLSYWYTKFYEYQLVFELLIYICIIN